jgi:pantothenate kinase
MGREIVEIGRLIPLAAGLASARSKRTMQSREIHFPATLEVTEQRVDLSALTQRQREFYSNLFSEIVDIYEASNKSRVVVGIAGPTGAGKSVVAVLLQNMAKQAGLSFALESITIDAYHYPNSFLCSHFADGESLKTVKGRFDTYDAQGLARDLGAFALGERVLFPTYSRKRHDPVKDGIVVEAKNALLIVEGLWLLYDKAGWEAVGPLLDYALFIEADTGRVRDSVLKRHMTGGRTLEEAARHYELVDARNSELVLTTGHRANKVIRPYYLIQ